MTLPGAVCGLQAPVRLAKGAARVPAPSGVDVGSSQVDVTTPDSPVFGNLDGGEKDEAVLHVRCYNTGGTAVGHVQDSMVVFSGSTGAVRAIGVLHPQHPGVPALPSLDYFSPEVSIGAGTITVHENQYVLPQDPTCCPSLHPTTVWTYRNGVLSPSTPKTR